MVGRFIYFLPRRGGGNFVDAIVAAGIAPRFTVGAVPAGQGGWQAVTGMNVSGLREFTSPTGGPGLVVAVGDPGLMPDNQARLKSPILMNLDPSKWLQIAGKEAWVAIEPSAQVFHHPSDNLAPSIIAGPAPANPYSFTEEAALIAAL